MALIALVALLCAWLQGTIPRFPCILTSDNRQSGILRGLYTEGDSYRVLFL